MAVLGRACHPFRSLTTTSSTLLPSQRGLPSRWFTSSRNLGLERKRPPLVKNAYPAPKQQAPPGTALAPANANRIPAKTQSIPQSHLDKLAKQSTILYQAPSHTAYVWVCYTFGTYVLSYSGYQIYNVLLNPAPGLAVWVPIAMGIVCCFTACVGVWSFLGPARLIRSISSLPNRSTPGALSLRIESRRMISVPFIKPKILTVPATDISFSTRLTVASSAEQTRLAEEKALRQKKKERELNRTRIMTAPFRHIGTLIWNLGSYLLRVMTRAGFLKVYIRGKPGSWKLDRKACWALDDGKALNKLVKLKK